jgi:hypothetical protein
LDVIFLLCGGARSQLENRTKKKELLLFQFSREIFTNYILGRPMMLEKEH